MSSRPGAAGMLSGLFKAFKRAWELPASIGGKMPGGCSSNVCVCGKKRFIDPLGALAGRLNPERIPGEQLSEDQTCELMQKRLVEETPG